MGQVEEALWGHVDIVQASVLDLRRVAGFGDSATFGVACVSGLQLLVANFLQCRCGVPTASVSVRQCNNTDL